MTEEKHPLVKRKEELAEHILVSHIISMLVVFMAIAALRVDFKLGQVPIFVMFFPLALIIILFVLVIPYLIKMLSPQSWTGEAILLTVLFPLVVVLVYLTEGFIGSKVLLIIPVVIAASSYGKTTGVICAALASAVIFALDIQQVMGHQVSHTFQLDIIFVSIMITVAWLIGGLTDIERHAQFQLLSLANTDGLTGLVNHRRFQEKLAEEVEKARKSSTPLSLIIMDIDYFKFYNDIYGHQRGDMVLEKIGRILQGVVSKPSFAARYGGDEFALVLPGVYKEDARQKADEVDEQLKSYPMEGDTTQPGGKIAVSFGVACFPGDGEKPKDLIKAADDSCYRSKYSGSRVYFSVIEQLYSLSRSEKDLVDCFKALLTVINAKDRYTFGHSERVMSYALAMADKMGLSEEQKTELKYSAYLHDVGKVEIEAEVLNKEGPLLESEWEIIKQHPVWGSDIVRPLVSMAGIVSTIRHHHENYNGSGYPDGLSSDDIPLTAKIIRIADSFDAMTTERSYKKARTFTGACAELRKHAGKMYDPALVDIFIGVMAER